MRLPHRDPIQLGPTAYESFQEKEGIPSVTGFFIEDLMDVEVKPWGRMGALGSYLNLGQQQETDAYICEIPSGKHTEPQHHLFETIIYIHKGRGATTVWFEGDAKQTFEWSAGAVFAIPLNVSYQHFNASNEPVRFLAGTNAPHVFNLFHNEDFIFRNPFQFRDRFRPDREFFNENKKLTIRSWESNLVPDVNGFPLDDYPMKGKGVKIMRFGLAGTTYGCHVQEFPAGSRSLFHAFALQLFQKHRVNIRRFLFEREHFVEFRPKAILAVLRAAAAHGEMAQRPVPRVEVAVIHEVAG